MANNVDMGQINWTVKATADQASDSVKKLSNNVSGLSKVLKLVNFTAFIAACRQIGQTIYKSINATSQYIQKMNQFKSIMGESAKEAQNFVDKAERILGLDPEQMMGSLSSFQTLTKGFGIASDEAYKMSKNLTQLAADMSSFTGESMDLALQRIKSGISGEIEPMRKWGIALDQATLQETAYALGINKRVAEMTRAQKTELAYYQIMHATQYAQGNMARTMLTPANAIRILQTEFKQLGRAIGSVFIPIALKIIPVIRAIVQILTELARKLAALFGFKIEDYDFSASTVQDIGASFGDLEDNVNGTTKALKKMLMPFDELNNVNFDTGSGSGGGIGGVGGGSLGLDTYDYDMFAGASDEVNKKVQQIKDTFEKLKPVIIAVGGLLAGLWTVNKIVTFVGWIQKVSSAFKFLSPVLSALKPIIGIVSTIAGAFLYFKGILDIFNPQVSYAQGLLKALAGTLLVIGGLLLLGVSPVAAIVAAVIAAVGIIGATIYRFRDEIGKFFTETIPNWFNSVIKWISELPSKLAYWNGYIIGAILAFFTVTLPNAIQSFFTQTLPEWGRQLELFFKQTIPQKFQNFVNWLGTLPTQFLEFGQNIINGLVNGVKHEWERFINMINSFVNGFIQGVKNALGIHSPSTVFSEIGINIIQGLINGIQSLLNKVKEIFENLKNGVTEKFETLRNNISTKVETIKDTVVSTFNNMKAGITDKISNIKYNIQNTFTDIKNGIVGKINDAKEGVRSAIDRIKGLVNFNWSLPHLKTPHLSWSTKPASGWVADILSALSLPTSLPKLNIEWYAEGGFPNAGELFFANEAGPELVGNIGRRTAVANQQQITEGISEATYNAFSRALNENRNSEGNTPHFVINIGDDKVYDGVAKKENQYSNMYGVRL